MASKSKSIRASSTSAPRTADSPVGAVVLILLGFVMLLDTTDIIGMDQLERWLATHCSSSSASTCSTPAWDITPAITPSTARRADERPEPAPHAWAITGPIIPITVGVRFTIDRFTPFTFHQTSPVLLIVVGILPASPADAAGVGITVETTTSLRLPVPPPESPPVRPHSITGPLLLVAVGVLFLVNNVWHDIPLLETFCPTTGRSC